MAGNVIGIIFYYVSTIFVKSHEKSQDYGPKTEVFREAGLEKI